MTPARSRRAGTHTRTERGIPEATVARLPVYLRALTALSDSGIATASSEDLATAAGVALSRRNAEVASPEREVDSDATSSRWKVPVNSRRTSPVVVLVTAARKPNFSRCGLIVADKA